MGDGQLAVDVVGDAVLLAAWVEVDHDAVLAVLLKGHLFDWTAEGWVDFQGDVSL